MGSYLNQNGDRYDGEWKEDKLDGVGQICFLNGDIYTGMFVDGK